MLKWLYSFLITLALPLMLLRLLVRSRHNPAYRQHWSQRLGWSTPKATKPIIWVHAVSLGETVAMTPLIESLLAQFTGYQVLLTHMTITGAARAKAHFGDRVLRQYLPYDLPFIIKPFVTKVRPEMVILAETELWPNFLGACKAQQIPVLLANGRMNARSASNYKRAGAMGRDMLSALSHIAAQTQSDALQFIDLGISPDRVIVTGNLKFDQILPEQQVIVGQGWKQQFARPTWIAASTQPSEEPIIMAAHLKLLQQFPNLLLIIVPRHPERFGWVTSFLSKQPISFAQHSKGELPTADQAVWLGDTMGQLFAYYAAADMAFVGASLAEIGGHSPVEPASLGVPVIMGPHVFKCQDSHDALAAVGALLPVTEGSIITTLEKVLANLQQRNAMAAAGKQWVAENQGATQRHIDLVGQLLGQQSRDAQH